MNPLTDKTLIDAILASIQLVVPEIILVAGACLLLTLGLFVRSRSLYAFLALATIAGAGFVASSNAAMESALLPSTSAVYAPIFVTPLAEFVRWLTLAIGVVLVLVASKETTNTIAADYFASLLVVLAGTSLVARSNDLIPLYLALEMISIPTYVLLYLPAVGKSGQEAAAKYFLLSVLASAITLFGMSYLFGLTGTTNLSAMLTTLTAANKIAVSPLAVFAVMVVIAGLCFRIGAVPFHFYAPDVYQGGPTAVVAQLAVVPKLAGFVALARILGFTQSPFSDQPFPNPTQVPVLLFALAAITMTLGNVLALLQDNLKRVLAFSGVANAGYMLLGIVTATSYAPAELALMPRDSNGLDAILFFLVGYSLMTFGVFAIITYLSGPDRPIETIDDLAGVGQSNPLAAAVLLVSLLSMIGLPLTAGFWGKLNLLIGLYDAPTTTGLGHAYKILMIVTVVNAAIAAVYYLRVVGVIYLRSPLRPTEPTRGTGPLFAGVVCAIATLVIGVYPQPILDLTKAAAPHGKAGISAPIAK